MIQGQAVVLAGGDSTRFWPFRNKVTMPFLSTSLVVRTVKQLQANGWKQILVVAHPQNKQAVADCLADSSVSVVEQTDPAGMAGAVRSCASLIKGKPLLVLSSADAYDDALFSSLAAAIAHHPGEGILTGAVVDSYFPGGYLTVADAYVTGIMEKPDPTAVPSNLISVACDYFPNADDLLQAIASVSSDRDDLFEQALQSLLNGNRRFRFFPYEGFWGYVKYPWHMLRLSSYFLSKLPDHRGKNVTIDPTAIINGPVYCEDNVRILEHAKLVGPVYLGAGTIVGNGTMIRDSMIGAGCVIGFGTEVTRSYIGDQCWFHKNYIGDSVLSDQVSFGAGAVTANYRLDGEQIHSRVGEQRVATGIAKLGVMIGRNVHVGVNASLMPGIKIGEDSFVSSGVVLDSDLPEASFCALQASSYVVKRNTHRQAKNDDADIRGKMNF